MFLRLIKTILTKQQKACLVQISVNIVLFSKNRICIDQLSEEEANKNNTINNNVKIERTYVPNTQNTYPSRSYLKKK
jgi:hypothetical protein